MFDLKSDTERRTFRFPLLNLAATERRALRRNFLKKGNTLRATAYECGDTTQPLETISLDRSY